MKQPAENISIRKDEGVNRVQIISTGINKITLAGTALTRVGVGLVVFSVLLFTGGGYLGATQTIHENLLVTDPIVRDADKPLAEIYRLLRNNLDKESQGELKRAQIKWIEGLDRALNQASEHQWRDVALEWTIERTKTLQQIYELRTGGGQSNYPENGDIILYQLIDSESNLRDGPGTSYPIIRRSQEGEVGKALENKNRWIRLQFSDGLIGWAHEQNLKVSNKSPRPRAEETEIESIPQRVVQQQDNRSYEQAAKLLCSEIATYWKMDGDDIAKLPKCLSNALVDRLEQLVPWSEIERSGGPKGRHPNLQLAYMVNNSLIAKPLDLAAMSELLDQGQSLDQSEVPWVAHFFQMLEARRKKSLALQQEALALINDIDVQAAESRMQQAVKEYPSPCLSGYSAALVYYLKITQDKSLRAVDGDWKMPSLPDKELVGKATEQASALRAFYGKEVLPAMSSLTKGLDAAGLLEKFSSTFEPAGSMDQPHPIRALQAMRKSEKYRELQLDDSVFTKPFLDRIKFLEELIGPKLKDYEKLIDQGAGLEREGKYLEATTNYRQAIGIEYSIELKQAIHSCEAKTSGL